MFGFTEPSYKIQSNLSDTSQIDSILRCDPQNERNLEYLIEELQKSSGVLPFVGAGLSMSLGLPGWRQFLEKEADRNRIGPKVAAFLNEGKYEEAADSLYQLLGHAGFDDLLEESFGEHRLPERIAETSALMQVSRLTSGPVVTTNFDRGLEHAFQQSGWPFTTVVWANHGADFKKALEGDRHVLLKMHGDIHERNGRIITLDQYQNAYGDHEVDLNQPLPRLIWRLSESRPLLFLGCSLHYDRPIKVLKKVYEDTDFRLYAIMEQPSTDVALNKFKKQLGDHGIRPIWFANGDYQSLPDLLAYLAQKRTQPAASQPAPEPPNPEPGPEINTGGDFWSERSWDHSVHSYLKERLVYYLARVRPYQRDVAVRALNQLVSEEGLGTVRAFELFGTYDLLIRAWLPGEYPQRLEELLKKHLGSGCTGIQQFEVQQVVHRWYRSSTESDGNRGNRQNALRDLDQQVIESIQDGRAPAQFAALRKAGLIFDRASMHKKTICFFISVNFGEKLDFSQRASVVREIADYLTSSHKLTRVSIDRGYGIMQILIKAEVEDYYAIDTIPDWIANKFETYKAITETFLSKPPLHISGDGRIGRATFTELRGRDFLVAAILPEIYERARQNAEIEDYLAGNEQIKRLGPGAKRFVRDFLMAVLNKKVAEWASVLMKLFFEWEGYLRDNHRKYLGKLNLNVNAAYEAAKIGSKPWDEFTLVDTLQVLYQGLKSTPRAHKVSSHWSELTNARNAASHNKKEVEDWRSMLNAVLEHWLRINVIICDIESVTGQKFDGSYREEC